MSVVNFEAIIESFLKSSWRVFLGVFVASGAILLFADKMGIKGWAHEQRAYLIGSCLFTGVVTGSHLATTLYNFAVARQEQRVDLKIVGGTPIYSNWSIGVSPLDKKPVLILMCDINFAHCENSPVIIKQAYLKGTKQILPMGDIVIEGQYDDKTSLCIEVSPVKSKPGRNLVGKLVFVDQFNEKHISENITFRPNTTPQTSRVACLKASPDCFFCHKPVELADQAGEAQMTAHTSCIWRRS